MLILFVHFHATYCKTLVFRFIYFFLRSVDQKFRKLSIHVDVFIVYCFKQNHYYIYIYIYTCRYLDYWNCKQYWYCRVGHFDTIITFLSYIRCGYLLVLSLYYLQSLITSRTDCEHFSEMSEWMEWWHGFCCVCRSVSHCITCCKKSIFIIICQ